MLKPIDFNNIDIQGELAVRAGLNYARLEGTWYRPDEVFTADQHGWPADWEGRIMLALTLYAQSQKRTPAYLEELRRRVPAHLNHRGYFGPALARGVNDEQQMSGHSWYLRSLVEHYQWKHDTWSMEHLHTVVHNLLVPSIGNYARYPLDPATRHNVSQWHLSQIQSKNEKHHGTSDCGCAFMPLDGVTAAYQILRTPKLRVLIDEMFAKYRQLDVRGLKVQTHATLSAVRGLIRMYEVTGEKPYLDFAVRRFDLYKKEAMTEAYGNYNWFGLPRWTEPCGIIDSFMVAVQLYCCTGRSQYLTDAHHIYFNALAHSQRPSGCLGTDNCVGAEGQALIHSHCFEVYWCCTMRAAEGLSRAIQYNFLTRNDSVVVPFYNDCHARIPLAGGILGLVEKTAYPYEGSAIFTITEAPRSAVEISFFVPGPDAAKAKLTVNSRVAKTVAKDNMLSLETSFKAGDVVNLSFGIPQQVCRTHNRNSTAGYHSFRHGVMMLGWDTATEVNLRPDAKLIPLGKGAYRVKDLGITLKPLNDVVNLATEHRSRQVLFRSARK
ncbi:MAG: hypothetical protein WCI73_00425 [Phycisphaerae bacterium]